MGWSHFFSAEIKQVTLKVNILIKWEEMMWSSYWQFSYLSSLVQSATVHFYTLSYKSLFNLSCSSHSLFHHCCMKLSQLVLCFYMAYNIQSKHKQTHTKMYQSTLFQTTLRHLKSVGSVYNMYNILHSKNNKLTLTLHKGNRK